ncbi:hypothetical protein Trydic_g12645 [Trypoxylus dichotomus]
MLCSLRKWGLAFTFAGLFCVLLIIFKESLTQLEDILLTKPPSLGEYNLEHLLDEFIVNTDKCKIPNINPWNSEVTPFYIKKKYVNCSNIEKLTKIVYRDDGVFLQIDEKIKPKYNNGIIRCCYSNIYREKGEAPDLGISVTPCSVFESEIQLIETSVLVSCKTIEGIEIYSNTHSLLPKRFDERMKIRASAGKDKPPNIILIGIDSMSRLNFHRVFSKTKQFLHENNWLEYKGYNKIGDNTLPNLMAVLTGKNLSTILKECDPRKNVDKCNFIWKKYSNLGYITAFAEDEISISTFTTYAYKGFRKQPTDFYFVPYMRASEKLLRVKRLDGMTFCAGPETSAERVLSIAREMILNYPEHPKFGFFWMNSFSHDDINAPTRVDGIFANFFSELQRHIDDNTMIIFLSDHGIRFGNIRLTRSGWLEERLPFLYLWIPKEFKRKFPNEAKNSIENAVKLVTPYDIYMTLQHVLELYNLNYVSKPSDGCPNCRSLFTHIDDRSCQEASIQFHWCTCFGYKYFDPSSELALTASRFAVAEINTLIDKRAHLYYKCARFTVRKIISAGISTDNIYNKTLLLLIIETIPIAKYEITVSVNYDEKERSLLNEGSISRLDRYESTSTCVTDDKIYCYCKWIMLFNLRFSNFWFEV